MDNQIKVTDKELAEKISKLEAQMKMVGQALEIIRKDQKKVNSNQQNLHQSFVNLSEDIKAINEINDKIIEQEDLDKLLNFIKGVFDGMDAKIRNMGRIIWFMAVAVLVFIVTVVMYWTF